MDSQKNLPDEKQFYGRPTIDHSKRILAAMAAAEMAIVLALLTFEQTQAIRFAIACFAVSLPISIVFAAKFEVDDPRDYFTQSIYPKFLYGLNLVIFVLGIAAVFGSGSGLYLLMLGLGGVLAAKLWRRKPSKKLHQQVVSHVDTGADEQSRAA